MTVRILTAGQTGPRDKPQPDQQPDPHPSAQPETEPHNPADDPPPGEYPRPDRPGRADDPLGPAENPAKEIGGRKGLEPTRYGDWEVKGIVSDF